jgi:hypothetical protein
MMNETGTSNRIATCDYCGAIHRAVCPMIKAIEYFEDGFTIKRVEFKTASDCAPAQSGYAPLIFGKVDGIPLSP